MADDVDRLFECFKCGVSPPKSAFREIKKSKRRPKQTSSVQEPLNHSDGPSSVSSVNTPSVKQKKKRRPKQTSSVQEPLSHSDGPSSVSSVNTTSVKQKKLCIQKIDSSAVKQNEFNNGRRFSPLVFYGSPNGVPPKRPTSLLRLLYEIRRDLSEQNTLKKEIWATFPRQEDAMKFAKEYNNVHIFSYQDHLNGQRRFLVSSYKEFWRRYKNMNPKYRHHYEVIQEGLPCHLYFDLEFNKQENANKNGEEMVDLLLSAVFDAFNTKYSIEGDNDWVVELDSSTQEKFSRHLIIRLPHIAFKNNTHAGAFVAEICSRIQKAKESDRRFENLLICKDSSSSDAPSQLFIDTAVYSRNRCFRLPLSSKAGKSSVLLPTGRFKCRDMSEEDVFMASLICNMDVDCEKLLICKVDMDCIKALQFDTEMNKNSYKDYGVARDLFSNSCTTDASRTFLMGKSPFPVLDMFVESLASSGSVSGGKIQSWYWFSEYGVMVYNMLRNRYCERIGRQHKSNHVIYVVDLRRAAYYQKCHDPDCRGYRSPLRPVPEEIVPDTTIFFKPVKHNDIQEIQEHNTDYSSTSSVDSCMKDGWLLEAVNFAEQVEKRALDFGDVTLDQMYEESAEWWDAVVSAATQTEQMYFGHR
uniref:DNA-directed primase/polymerase protein n=1 Tax=Daucus carota subsp. sativus TaxID=79200 RepID=A0A162AFI4_DAUCS